MGLLDIRVISDLSISIELKIKTLVVHGHICLCVCECVGDGDGMFEVKGILGKNPFPSVQTGTGDRSLPRQGGALVPYLA